MARARRGRIDADDRARAKTLAYGDFHASHRLLPQRRLEPLWRGDRIRRALIAACHGSSEATLPTSARRRRPLRGLRLLTEEDKRYMEHFMPSSVAKLIRMLL